MPSENVAPTFAVISGAEVHSALQDDTGSVVDLIAHAYRLHGQGDTVNPPSYFLRFPDRPRSRIIALPASVGGDAAVDGIKWISSFPDNIHSGLPRASAVLVLNNPRTGYPYACLESSIISAARTAASAALAADWLTRDRARPRRLGFVGAGLIARYVLNHLVGTGWTFESTTVHDLSAEQADSFAGYCGRFEAAGSVTTGRAEELIRSCDLVVFATVAAVPHVTEPGWFDHNPVVLHLSLRDLAPEVLLRSVNVVDDVEHCLKADTSPHLAEQLTGGRDFLDGTLYDVMQGRLRPALDRPVIFSPFGLGVLDLVLGRWVYERIASAGGLRTIDDFFFDLRRHADPASHGAR
ncbi:2,3-diaminopropionate biosynthesis protein SbnB [Micromonospora profundi]|uniref:2,3-diaminopropionate biosynthesis protein SbnB n=1 Tax=Micromonospora profundi TaxID=1420889 RepID=UPI00339F40AF